MIDIGLRIVVDTNVLLSFLMKRTSTPGQVVELVLQQHQLLFSDSTLQELRDKCVMAKFRRYFSQQEADQFIEQMALAGEHILVGDVVTDCRDAKDNKFLELALSGFAVLIVSGDSDLKDLNPFRGITILSPYDSLQMLATAE